MTININQKLLLFIFLSLVAAIIFQNLVGVAIMELMGKSILLSSLKTYVKAGGDPDAFVMIWPLYYILINCFVFSIFWFFLGRVAYNKFSLPYWRYALIVPMLYFLISLDFTFIIYLLVTLVGAVSVYLRSVTINKAI